MRFANPIYATLVCQSLVTLTTAFELSCNKNYVSYYGQNSARNQQSLGAYCQDAIENVIVLSFMDGFPNIDLNFANACETTFDGSHILHCPSMAADIKFCQSKGKVVLLSLGGASGAYSFQHDDDGKWFADTVWNKFFKGSDAQRPFDDAVLDGIDLDIEGGSDTGYTAFIEQLRLYYRSDSSKRYYIAAAPQCPFPDAYLGPVLNSAWFDMVFVQFYNNYCGLNAFPGWFNFNDWDNWARTHSVNKDVKVFIGAPGASSAASYGYVDGATLKNIYNDVRAKYPSLGGVMTWDVSQARTSGIAGTIRTFLDSDGHCGTNSTTTDDPSHDSSAGYVSSSGAQFQTHTPVLSPAPGVTNATASGPASAVSPTSKSHSTVTTAISPSNSTTRNLSTSIDSLSSSTKSNRWGWPKPVASSKTSTPVTTPQSTKQSTRGFTTDIQSTSTPPKSTPDPSDSSVDSACPVEGTTCEPFSQACTLTGYALCVGGKWALYPCGAGTKCYLFGASAACDWHSDSEKPTCRITSAEQFAHITRPKSPLVKSKAWTLWHFPILGEKGIKARVEFLASHIVNGHYKALVKLTSLVDPIPANWMLRFDLPPGQTLENANGGVATTDNSTVTIHPEKDLLNRQNRMSVAIGVSGKYNGNFVVPDLSTARLTQR